MATTHVVDTLASWQVIDLRNNPGGQLTEALAQASFLLPDEGHTLAYTIDATGSELAHTVQSVRFARSLSHGQQPSQGQVDVESSAANGGGIDGVPSLAGVRTPTTASLAHPASVPLVPASAPMVVLVDRGTASSAELFAAALHDNQRAMQVGESTFGKSLIQRIYPMPNGGALKLTIGEYYRPNHGRVHAGVGLQPDVKCVSGEYAAEEDVCVERAADLAMRMQALPPAGQRVLPLAPALRMPSVRPGLLRP